MVYRVFVEKKPGLDVDARSLASDLREFLGISALERLRIINRYDVEDIDKALFDRCRATVFSEPQLDDATDTLEAENGIVFAVESLPGQFDQRADSAAQCVQLLSQGERPTVRTARIYVLYGALSEADVARIKHYVINPVEAREASLNAFDTLKITYDVPTAVPTVEGFTRMDRAELMALLAHYALAMDIDDLLFCQQYFINEQRDPTLTEIRMLDTYWSDHCRHTTFLTTIDRADIAEDDEILKKTFEMYQAARTALGRESKPMNLMDLGTIAAKYLKKTGKLTKLDESEEINACTVKIDVNVDGQKEPWLLLFKNETHNHPTEIEPFGGAATCIGGAIRDPLSGRSYVYGAMRVTGAADPLKPIKDTLPGKLPQRKIVTTAAAGYSSYGNQIGLATGQVDELYHPGYAAKRMEIGAVIAATPAKNVRRETPLPGDVIILLGGRTGRDGCGGATGSSKSHTTASLSTCGAEVQKGNAPEERKLQRLFRNAEAARMMKRCNDFGAGGVSVAIGELADGLDINLNAVPKKYDGLDGTELAISESQERMAVVVEPKDVERFLALADAENLEATVVAHVTEAPRLVMHWNGKTIVDISRDFLNSNGAEKHIAIQPAKTTIHSKAIPSNFVEGYRALADDLNVCSKRGLSERFDSTIGAGTVLMPFGGKYQLTPSQVMAQKISIESHDTDDASLMAWGFNPAIAEQSPYHAAYLAVVESVAKLVAAGASFEDVYLTFQEYFQKPMKDGARWGQPFAALLGAFRAQVELGVAAIGGKDSMSGTFEHIDVPPTLTSFAVTTDQIPHIISNEFKGANHRVVLVTPEMGADGLPVADRLIELWNDTTRRMRKGDVLAAYTPTFGGVAEAAMKMAFGNGIGIAFDPSVSLDTLFGYAYGGFVLELSDDAEMVGTLLGHTTADGHVTRGEEALSLEALLAIYEGKLESVFPCNIPAEGKTIPAFSYEATNWPTPRIAVAKPRVLIPVFPGTNCEYDSAKAFERAGAQAELVVINNLTSDGVARSVERFAQGIRESQLVFVPGGFSGGDEPDGSAKLITAFFRNEAIKEAITNLLADRDGLMLGICNGFQALIKLGLVTYGKIIDTDAHCPTLTFNRIGRHQSRLVRTRVASNRSPWLKNTRVGDVFTVPISHGEGRFLADDDVIRALAENGQIATQYVDLDGIPTDDVHFNPNGSAYAIEGITSPDGRVFGKMGHSERVGTGLYKNVIGEYDMGIFQSAVQYFQKN